jgi:hypothetical protein
VVLVLAAALAAALVAVLAVVDGLLLIPDTDLG